MITGTIAIELGLCHGGCHSIRYEIVNNHVRLIDPLPFAEGLTPQGRNAYVKPIIDLIRDKHKLPRITLT